MVTKSVGLGFLCVTRTSGCLCCMFLVLQNKSVLFCQLLLSFYHRTISMVSTVSTYSLILVPVLGHSIRYLFLYSYMQLQLSK